MLFASPVLLYRKQGALCVAADLHLISWGGNLKSPTT